MGWLTTDAQHPTLRAKRAGRHAAKGGALCQECGNPIRGAKFATHHPACAKRAAARW